MQSNSGGTRRVPDSEEAGNNWEDRVGRNHRESGLIYRLEGEDNVASRPLRLLRLDRSSKVTVLSWSMGGHTATKIKVRRAQGRA